MITADERSAYAVVEDDPLMANLVSNMLASSDVDIEMFMLIADFLKCENLQKFKAILLDLSLPDIDGLKVLERLEALSVCAPVVLMSAHESHVLAAAKIVGNGYGLNVTTVLRKPYARQELLSALEISV